MTPEDIDKLADEYADKECAMSRHTGKKLKQLHVDKIIEFYDVFGFLIERYCIVPKSKVNALHEEIHGEIMCAHDDDDWQSVAHYILDVMPRTFLDIFGKDMFEEEGK